MILASKSPRRKEILENFGFNFKVLTKEIEEVSDKETIKEQIEDIALKKCFAVAFSNKDEYVLAADTVVILDNEILCKPKSEEDAYKMLNKLSGRDHDVITSYAIVNLNKNFKLTDSEVTKVKFKFIKDEDIKWYISTGEPMDKAGSYGIQGKGSMFVEGIEGDFYNVMGFPLSHFVGNLIKRGFNIEQLLKL